MKAKTRAEKRRIRKAQSKPRQDAPKEPISRGPQCEVDGQAPLADKTVELTPQRASHGVITKGDKNRPALVEDPLAAMLRLGGITYAEEQAGRSYAALAYAAHRSMGIRSHVSCLAGGSGGYDGDDGLVRVEREWRHVTTILPVVSRAYLDRVVIDGHAPTSLSAMTGVRKALKILAEIW